MKEIFEAVELELIIIMNAEDIITLSRGNGEGDDDQSVGGI